MSSLVTCLPGDRVFDSLPFSEGGTVGEAQALKNLGYDRAALYLGVAKPAQFSACVSSGLAVFGVTLAGAYDGAAAVAQAKAFGLEPGTTLFLDLEGKGAYTTPPATLIAKINAWADVVAAGGYMPGLYVGVPQPLTSAELYALRVVRYWRGQGRITDRFGALAEPECGWCQWQAWPSITRGGVLIDANLVTQDFHGRTPACTA